MRSWRTRLGERCSPEAVADLLAEGIGRVSAGREVSGRTLPAIGVGLAAQLRGTGGVVAVAPNLGWHDVNFGSLAEKRLGRPVVVLNDVDAAALGEATWGAARGLSDVLVVFAGTGVGAGLIAEGRLLRGAGGVAGEIGHVKVRPGGRRCGCGQRGCLEAYLGGANLSAWLRRRARADWPELLRVAGGEAEAINPGTAEVLVRVGDRRAVRLWRQLARWFGLVLANAVTLLDPAALVWGGTVLERCPLLRAEVEAVLRREVLAASRSGLRVLSARLRGRAGVMGAASYVLTRYRSSPAGSE